MMVDKKRKSRNGATETRKKKKTSNKKKIESKDNRVRRGPHLPNAIRREVDRFSRSGEGESASDDEQVDFDDGVRNDFYEYEEDVPEEETMKNKRFDPVENYQFELPENFQDVNVTSDEDDEDDNLEGDDEDETEDEGRHARMLEEITGLPSDAFGGKKKKDFIISEAYPESEYNPSGDILDGDGRISIEDLMDPLHGKTGFSKLRKNLHRMDKKSIHAPLPKTDQDRIERKAAYEQSKKDITKWEPVVKRNREASTLYFDEDVDLGFSTIGAIASGFRPRTDFEKKIASFVNQNEVVDAHKNDGARLLELNKISVEEMKDRQERLAKMRSFLFAHEMKAKRIKKIKSKTYHRLLKKDRKKAAEAAFQMDPEAAKEQAMKQEFKRAEERMTLKHKNSSKWAKRILQRGLQVQDDATREAFNEQLNQHAALTRKMNSVKESSDSDESSDDDDSDDMSAGSDQDKTSKLLTKAKEKTMKVLQGDEELPKSGVLSLPFMVRGLKKRKEEADEEAKRALEEYDSSLTQLEDKNMSGSFDKGASSGRRTFGIPKKIVSETSKKQKSDNYYGNSDSEDDFDAKEEDVTEHNQDYKSLREVEVDPNLLREEFGMSQDSVFKSFEDAENPEPKSTYEVAFLASNSWKKMRQPSDTNKKNGSSNSILQSGVTIETVEHDQNTEESGDDDDASDSDSGGEMVDGILSSGPKSAAYELPSQAELIQRAFAGDDVEEEFEKDKEAVLDEENPEPEKPVLLPGWGQWTNVQKKKGLPSWMVQEHEIAKNKRLESLKKRKDAHLNNVIISEKLDRKAEKLHTKTLPYPFTSTEVFEQSIRMPIGPEFNPATAVGALNRPEVVKRAGLNIKPIQYEDMSVRERVEARKRDAQKQRNGKDKSRSMKKTTAKV
ncbi:hypothetical protein ABFS82_03G117800 [Erythranthe guttata]|nr:PREDICTED: U3 small nucleolar RNA-associated protein 14 homolog A isoform X2 [Erythranthe guttata]|eukprot:XP_012854925.1 PREDICTED: U3 small nucleolar RNA-associated protein 14 homolog A isoform X2 [Erythranthe guttata]